MNRFEDGEHKIRLGIDCVYEFDIETQQWVEICEFDGSIQLCKDIGLSPASGMYVWSKCFGQRFFLGLPTWLDPKQQLIVHLPGIPVRWLSNDVLQLKDDSSVDVRQLVIEKEFLQEEQDDVDNDEDDDYEPWWDDVGDSDDSEDSEKENLTKNLNHAISYLTPQRHSTPFELAILLSWSLKCLYPSAEHQPLHRSPVAFIGYLITKLTGVEFDDFDYDKPNKLQQHEYRVSKKILFRRFGVVSSRLVYIQAETKTELKTAFVQALKDAGEWDALASRARKSK